MTLEIYPINSRVNKQTKLSRSRVKTRTPDTCITNDCLESLHNYVYYTCLYPLLINLGRFGFEIKCCVTSFKPTAIGGLYSL